MSQFTPGSSLCVSLVCVHAKVSKVYSSCDDLSGLSLFFRDSEYRSLLSLRKVHAQQVYFESESCLLIHELLR